MADITEREALPVHKVTIVNEATRDTLYDATTSRQTTPQLGASTR